jgi:precorrin-6B methylase 2
MSWRVPVELEDAVLAAARAELGAAALAPRALHRAIVDRSVRYTSERDRLAAPGDPLADLAARAAFFTIADAMKIALPLAELANRTAIPARRPLRVVDVGAGCGAMTLGALVALGVPLDVVAVDRDARALRIAAAAVRALAARRGVAVAIATRSEDVERAALPPCDIVAIGSTLNELAEPARLPLVARALAAIGDDGAVVIVEPALRDTARALHALRDAVIARQLGHVFAPCTRAIAPCTALADPDDWCHEDRVLELPPRTAELARVTRLRDRGMKLAYLVLRRDARALVDAPGAWRVVAMPRATKGKLELVGCGDRGRAIVRLLGRDRATANRALDHARRGEVIVVDGEPRDGVVDRAAPPPGGADDRERVPVVDRTAPPVGGAADRERVPVVDRTAPPVGGAADRERVPVVEVRADTRAARIDPSTRSS